MFNKLMKKFLIFALPLIIVSTIVLSMGLISVKAISSSDKVAYPFSKGYPLANAATITGQSAQSAGDTWQWYEQKFDASVDLTSATYLAVEYQNTVGNPGLTIGVMSNGQRFGTYVDSKPIYFVDLKGNVTELSVLYGSVNLGTNAGMILIPMSSLSLVGWGAAGSTLSGAASFFFETNAKYNWGFQMKIGEVAYYTGDPLTTTPVKVLDLSTEAKSKNSYASNVDYVWPTESIDTTKATYPFAKGDYALANAPKITGEASQATGDSWNWIEQIYDANKDLTSASYVAIEYENVSGNPGLTLGVMSNGARFGTYTDGKPVYFVTEDGKVSQLSVLYSSVNLGVGAKGMIVLPLSSLSIVSWGNQQATLNNSTSFFFETNGKYNWGFEFKIGEIAVITGEIIGGKYEKVLDLSKEIKTAKTSVSVVTATFPSKATDTTKDPANFIYPFGEGTANAPTVKGQANQSTGDVWQWFEAIFDQAVDLTSATYLAVEYENLVGDPGLTIGVMSNGQRFGTYVDGKPVYFVAEDGTISELAVKYGAVNLGTTKGLILVPMSSLSLVSWGVQGTTLAGASSFFFETNAKYNWNFQMRIAEVGYYTEDPFKGASMTKVLDLSNGMKKNKVYASAVEVEFPASSDVKSIVGMTAEYPFNKGTDGFNNSMCWVGTAAADSKDNWQTFMAKFDKTDLSAASYLAIQYNTKSGAPGITIGLQNGKTRYSIVGSDGEEICLLGEDGNITRGCYITYDAITIGGGNSGCLLIPMNLLNLQFGDAENTKANATQVVFTTNSKYNFLYELLIGEIGYFVGQPCDDNFEYHRLSGLNFGTPDYFYSVNADNKDNKSTTYVYVTEEKVFGDTTIEYTATGKIAGSIIPWVGGANGTQTMTKDSYGAEALELTCTGPRENADAYTAFTIFDGKHIDWSNAKGITLWARNDSDTEVSFNLEIDVLSSHTTSRGRFNITQGNRFWLYDVNTGEQTIYMTRPCVTLPVGFEGWVRIPFDAFDQAAWSLTDANYGVFERQYFMTEGSYVPYMGITVYSGSYTNCSFAVNKIGGYTTTPSFVSAFIPADETKKTILALMGLDK